MGKEYINIELLRKLGFAEDEDLADCYVLWHNRMPFRVQKSEDGWDIGRYTYVDGTHYDDEEEDLQYFCTIHYADELAQALTLCGIKLDNVSHGCR